MGTRRLAIRRSTIVLLAGAALGPAASRAAEPAPIAYAYNSGSQTAQTVKAKGYHAQVNFSAVRPRRPPAELPDESILLIPGFEYVHAPGPAVRTPLSPERRSAAVPAAAGVLPIAPNAAGDFVTFVASSLSGLPANMSSTAPEPSVAAHDQIVFVTGNWYAALSINNGVTFS